MNDTLTNDLAGINPDLQCFRDQIFAGVIGQVKPKNEVHFYLDGYQTTKVVPHLLIIAPKGQGKTKIARTTARGLYQYDAEGKLIWGYIVTDDAGQQQWVTCGQHDKVEGHIVKPKKKAFVEINCASLRKGGLHAFVNNILMKNIIDKDVTVFFDEASEIPLDIAMALLTILEINNTYRTRYVYEGYVCDVDFRRQSFIFATTESQKIFDALRDRLERVTLQEYSQEELQEIVKINLPDIQVEDKALADIATVLRGNARSAFKMSEKIKTYLSGRTMFTYVMWQNLKCILSINPLGLNAIEVQMLQALKERPNGTSLTRMSAKTGMSREQLRQDTELYLMKYDLMEITTTGRNITPKGIEYLRTLPIEPI